MLSGLLCSSADVPRVPMQGRLPAQLGDGKEACAVCLAQPLAESGGCPDVGIPLHAGTRRTLGGEVSVADKSHFPACAQSSFCLCLK